MMEIKIKHNVIKLYHHSVEEFCLFSKMKTRMYPVKLPFGIIIRRKL